LELRVDMLHENHRLFSVDPKGPELDRRPRCAVRHIDFAARMIRASAVSSGQILKREDALTINAYWLGEPKLLTA
jgi:hypothetical protein